MNWRLHRKLPGMQKAGGGRYSLGAEAKGKSWADCATGTSPLMQMPVLILSSVLWTNKSDAELNGPLQRNAPPSWPPSSPPPTPPSPKPLPHTLQALFHPLNALCCVQVLKISHCYHSGSFTAFFICSIISQSSCSFQSGGL